MSFKIFIDEIKQNLEKILQELGFPNVNFSVEIAKPGFGDASSNVSFLLSKHLQKKPFEISQEISSRYTKYLGKLVSEVTPHPSGYLNFFAVIPELNRLILQNSQKEDYGFIDVGKGKRIVVEHTSVNPNKALHIGHVRNIVIGDTVSLILKKANFDVKVLNYVDDSGLQVADIILGFRHLGFSEAPPSNQKFDHYCGDVVYVRTTEKYSTEPELEEKRKKILQDLEDSTSEIAKFADTITKKVLANQLETCWNLGVTYDCLNFESQIIRSGLWNNIFEKLKELHLIEFEKEGKNSGCWVIRGEKNEEDKVVVRSNGTATYIAKDIPYAAWKLGLINDPFYYEQYPSQQPDGKPLWQTTLIENNIEKQNFTGDKVITVIDSRQSRLQKIITILMSKFKSKNDAYVHLGYESVTLSSDTAKNLGLDTQGKQAQMSGRKGIYVNADSVLDLPTEKTRNETTKRNPDLASDELQKIATGVAVGALRYEMIKQDLDKIITFDLVKSLSLEGDTAPYLQYSFARASRILEKASFLPDFETSFDLLTSEYETKLVKTIGLFDIQVRDSALNLSPKVLAKYAYNLAVDFNSFYEHVKVLEGENKPLINQRLCLVLAFKSTLGKTLGLLGIESPQKM